MAVNGGGAQCNFYPAVEAVRVRDLIRKLEKVCAMCGRQATTMSSEIQTHRITVVSRKLGDDVRLGMYEAQTRSKYAHRTLGRAS
jgi:hypothetical protein